MFYIFCILWYFDILGALLIVEIVPPRAGEFLEITNNLLRACLSYANQPIQNPCHQPLPLSNSPTLKAIIAPALITPGPSTKQLGITPVAQSPQK